MHEQLTRSEWCEAMALAYQRTKSSYQQRLNKGIAVDTRGWNEGFAWDLTGAAAERFAAKALGLPWDGGTVDTFSSRPDLVFDGVPLQVRGSGNPESPLRLRLRDMGHLQHVFALVVGDVPHQRLVGFIAGSHAIAHARVEALRRSGAGVLAVDQARLVGWAEAVQQLARPVVSGVVGLAAATTTVSGWRRLCERISGGAAAAGVDDWLGDYARGEQREVSRGTTGGRVPA